VNNQARAPTAVVSNPDLYPNPQNATSMDVSRMRLDQ
jgi:hypothetical protein